MSPKPKLGQHFLKDIRYVHKAIDAAEITPEDGIIEVGPGKGVLTKYLLKKAGKVLALELDERLANRLHEKMGENGNLSVELQDARYVNWNNLIEQLRGYGCRRIKLVSNLPYYLATQMVIHLLAAAPDCERIVVMVQDEVARRMCSPAGGKDYGAYSVMIQYYAEPSYIVKVPPSAFQPAPRVSSALVRLDRRAAPAVSVKDPDRFSFLVHAMFSHRRKTARNCLQGVAGAPDVKTWEQVLKAANVDPSRRPETLRIDEFAALADRLPLTSDTNSSV